ncbi:sensor domain-containing diguanylate cyclase [Vibrio nigripulchritudo]|uniref:sensor domain-containing diguanylate cyclase n=1 Tax=Vibrio nigripulchritudo TaxID=28173 RepID=UPI0024932A40|nr:sensor domain-containing diguanylate cyclase [Vibrio nigripulchritudo]BDU36099.1 diguanylate cyclase [Vibrio nigripulchritudo]BDU41754.1 diguanylate cyclase [Vibrio nigripulchritudo]
MKVKNLIFYIALTCLVLSTGAALMYHKRHSQLVDRHIEQIIAQSQHQMAFSERELSEIEIQLRATMELLRGNRFLYDYVDKPIQSNRVLVEELWMSIASSQQWFKTIYFMDLKGKESVAVDYSFQAGTALARHHLLSHQDSQLFEFANNLIANEIASYGLTIKPNDVAGETHFSPVLEIVTPIYSGGERQGYLVFVLDVWFLMSVIEYSPNSQLMPEVVTKEGDYLVSKDREKLFGFLLPERQKFNLSNTHPEAWQQIKEQQRGYVLDDGNLLVFYQVEFFKDGNVKLLIEISEAELNEGIAIQASSLLRQFTYVLVWIFLFAIPTAYFIYLYKKRNLESKLAIAALHGMSAVIIADKRHRIIQVNREFESLSGFDNDEVVGRNALKLLCGKHSNDKVLEIAEGLKDDGVWEGELINAKSSGDQFVSLTRIQSIDSETARSKYFILSLFDITERKRLEQQLRQLSERDALTGCWNRRKFDQELFMQTRLVDRYSSNACLALLDIDHFKRINDEFGHDEGDRVICAVATTLEGQLRETDFLARIGGEEFAIILPNTQVEQAEILLNRLRIAIELEASNRVTVSAGITDICNDTKRSYKCADIALYESKTQGRNQVSVCMSDDDVA